MSRSLETRLSRLEDGRGDSRLDFIKKMSDDELQAIVDEAKMAIQTEYRKTGKIRIPRLQHPNDKEVVSRFVMECGIPLSVVIWEGK